MITPVTLAHISIMSYIYYFFYVVRTFKIWSHSYLEVCNTISLNIITMLSIRSPELI